MTAPKLHYHLVPVVYFVPGASKPSVPPIHSPVRYLPAVAVCFNRAVVCLEWLFISSMSGVSLSFFRSR